MYKQTAHDLHCIWPAAGAQNESFNFCICISWEGCGKSLGKTLGAEAQGVADSVLCCMYEDCRGQRMSVL